MQNLDDGPVNTDPDAWREDWPPSWGLRQLLTSLVVALLAFPLLAAALVPALIGAAPATVISGSMEPVLSPGDVVVMETVDTDALRVGDIVSYVPAPELDFGYTGVTTTHRVISLTLEDGAVTKIQLKGDANPLPDPLPASPEQIQGRMVYSVPFAGLPALAARNLGISPMAIIFAGIGGYLVMNLLSRRSRR